MHTVRLFRTILLLATLAAIPFTAAQDKAILAIIDSPEATWGEQASRAMTFDPANEPINHSGKRQSKVPFLRVWTCVGGAGQPASCTPSGPLSPRESTVLCPPETALCNNRQQMTSLTAIKDAAPRLTLGYGYPAGQNNGNLAGESIAAEAGAWSETSSQER